MMDNKIKSLEKYFEPAVNIICAVITACGVITSVLMNFVGRSLWFDEAALAYSLSTRDLFELAKTGLDYVQAAPVGWLYLEKIFTLIFGNSAFVLRLPSILFYVGMLVIIYLFSSDILDMDLPLLPVAFTASLPVILQYSNMFKPYMADCFFTVLLLYVYYGKREDEVDSGSRALLMGVFFGAVIWFSNPACFVIGGILAAAGLFSLFEREWKRFSCAVLTALPVAASFALYYFCWLVKIDGGMYGFWAAWKFPIFPKNMDDITQFYLMGATLMQPFYRLKWIIAAIVAAGFIFCIYWKAEKMIAIYLSLFLAAFASSLGMFPVNKRMWLFIYPFITLIVFFIGHKAWDFCDVRDWDVLSKVVVAIMVFACVLNGGIRYYIHSDNVWWPRYEVKGEYEYLCSILKPDDRVYVFSAAAPMFLYYNDYETDLISPRDKHLTPHYDVEVYVGDEPLGEAFDCREDLDFILEGGDCYIVMSDTWDDPAASKVLWDTTAQYGTMEQIYFEHDTPLYHFVKNGE